MHGDVEQEVASHPFLPALPLVCAASVYPSIRVNVLPSRRGWMIGVDWIVGLQATAAGFNMIQNHVDLLSGKVHAVPTR